MDFQKIWDAYPVEQYPCGDDDGWPHFDNQCAIRLSVALTDGGVNTKSCKAVTCWHGHKRRHFLRAEELAEWFESKPAIFGKTEIRTNADYTHYLGRTGIILCRNFWGTGNQGDHIDLWNLNHMKTGQYDYISRSQEVWFWHIKSAGAGHV